MIFISYYTSGAYKKVMEDNLLPTLEEFHLPYYIEEVKGIKNWHDGTDYKATFILECLKKFKDDVVFIDADAQIVDLPSLFYEIPKKYDIAVHYLDWGGFWRGTEGSHHYELCSGTMLFRYNERTICLCEDYIKRCEKRKIKSRTKSITRHIRQRRIRIKNISSTNRILCNTKTQWENTILYKKSSNYSYTSIKGE